MKMIPNIIRERGHIERELTTESAGMSAILRRFEGKNPSPDSFVKIEAMAIFGVAKESNAVPTKGNSTQKSNGCIVPMQHNDTSVRASAHFTNARSAKATASLTAKKSSIGTRCRYASLVSAHRASREPGFEPVICQPKSSRHPAPTESKAK